MPAESARIFSDIHYGDRASSVLSVRQLQGLTEGVDSIILNGDTLDTRAGPHPERTAERKAEIIEFFSGTGAGITYVTGNHDPDISACHACEIAGGEVLVTHGDIIFDDIVPWGAMRGSFAVSFERRGGRPPQPRSTNNLRSGAVWLRRFPSGTSPNDTP